MTLPYHRQMKAWAKKRAAIVRLSQKGIPKAEIARKYGLTRQRISQIVQTERQKSAENAEF